VPDGPPSQKFTEIEPKELPPSQWDAAVQEKRQQILSERIKHFQHSLARVWQRSKSE